MSNLIKMCLIDGEVVLRVKVTTMLSEEVAYDDKLFKQNMIEIASELIKDEDYEVIYDKWEDVLVSEKTAEWHVGSKVDKFDWEEVVEESNSNNK